MRLLETNRRASAGVAVNPDLRDLNTACCLRMSRFALTPLLDERRHLVVRFITHLGLCSEPLTKVEVISADHDSKQQAVRSA